MVKIEFDLILLKSGGQKVTWLGVTHHQRWEFSFGAFDKRILNRLGRIIARFVARFSNVFRIFGHIFVLFRFRISFDSFAKREMCSC